METGNSQALDLICHRYQGAGSPSMYLRRVGSIKDIALDYAMARHHRQREATETMDGLADSIRSLGSQPDADRVAAVTLQWLVQVMSSK